MRLLGVESGSVSAFALINDAEHQVRLVLDRRIADAPRVAMHPLDNARTTVIAASDLLRFLDVDRGHPADRRPRLSQGAAQPSPSSVRPAGRYSQPTQPS